MKRTVTVVAALPAAAILLTMLGGCSGRSNLLPGNSMANPLTPQSRVTAADDTSILKLLKKQVVIGSTVDPKYGQLNPYGLSVATSTSGAFTKGDLAVCNFNAKSNVQGTGFTIVALHPAPGSKPVLVAANKSVLMGCAALALSPSDDIWATAFSSNDNPVLSASGKLEADIKGAPFDHPWGQVYAQPTSGSPVFYESNAGNGAVIRINLGSKFTYDAIAKGFAVNHGQPGSIFGPSGLTYNPQGDILYVVDGTNNTIVALNNVSTIPAGGVVVEKGGKTFGGKFAKDAQLLYSGGPLDGPISATLLPNGNLVVGNTSNASGSNIMVEISASGKLLATRNVDKGAAGALFGIVATGTSDSDTKIFFNDDNDNNLQALEK